MAREGISEWIGASGAVYRYNIYPIGTRMKPEEGNYIYARHSYDEHGEQVYYPVYIGQGILRKRARLNSRDDGDCIEDAGATHFHSHRRNADKRDRLAEETDLRNSYDTPCNDQ